MTNEGVDKFPDKSLEKYEKIMEVHENCTSTHANELCVMPKNKPNDECYVSPEIYYSYKLNLSQFFPERQGIVTLLLFATTRAMAFEWNSK
jgi:hypothetical protein